MVTSALPTDVVRSPRQRYFPGLDGIRAVAVSLVILYHSELPVPGGTGVLLFFVLSGFLITWLLLEEAETCGTVSLGKFYARRALRILPAFYVYTAAQLLMLWLRHRPIHYGQLTAALLYYNNYWQGIHGDPNTGFSHTWSLAVEEQFYLLWPILFLMLRRNRAQMARFLGAGIATVWVYRLILVLAVHVDQGYIYEAFDTRADSLMIGCLLAVLQRDGLARRLFRFIAETPWIILVTATLFVVSSVAELNARFDYRDTMGFAVNGALAFVLIAHIVCVPDAPWMRVLELAPVRYLGKISYALYLWQQLAVPVAGKLLVEAPPVLRVAGQFAAVVAVASASWFLVEKPFLRLKKRFNTVVS